MFRKTVLVVLCLSFCASALVYGQIDRKRKDDAFKELDENELTLRFFNALDGNPIENATVVMAESDTFVTDFEGKFSFAIPEDGYYTVDFKKQGYIPSKFEIEIMAGTLIYNQFSISPVMPVGKIRVVLDWGDDPEDLDAHFAKQGGYHISYRSMKVAADGVAQLDRDDMTGKGPETITANRIDKNAVYTYFIHDYTNRRKAGNQELAKSRAHVQVYGNNQLLHVYTVPQSGEGTYWPVFQIINGEVKAVQTGLSSEISF